MGKVEFPMVTRLQDLDHDLSRLSVPTRPGLRPKVAGSPLTVSRIEFLILRTDRSPPIAPTPRLATTQLFHPVCPESTFAAMGSLCQAGKPDGSRKRADGCLEEAKSGPKEIMRHHLSRSV